MNAAIIEYSLDNVPKIAERIKRGEVGIFPCDTIYGICASVSEANAERIYSIKERPQSKSFIELMTKADVIKRGLEIESDILDRWPAPFTAIARNPEGGTTAVRVPSDPFLQGLLALSGPIYSTSVNISGERSLLSFEEIFPVFASRVDFIVKHESLVPGKSSTLIDITSKPYRILRQGEYCFE